VCDVLAVVRSALMAMVSEFKNPVLHVVVVAFHHKKGCQVIYIYSWVSRWHRIQLAFCRSLYFGTNISSSFIFIACVILRGLYDIFLLFIVPPVVNPGQLLNIINYIVSYISGLGNMCLGNCCKRSHHIPLLYIIIPSDKHHECTCWKVPAAKR